MKKFLTLILSIMTVLVMVTGCGSKKSSSASEADKIKLDASVTAKDLLTSDNMKAITDISTFKGAYDLDVVLDLVATVKEEDTAMKDNLSMNIEYDGNILHAAMTAKSDTMDEISNEMWCSGTDKTKYSKDDNGTWHKTTDVTPEELISDLVNTESMSSDINIDEMLKDFKLELDEENNTYVLTYEASIKDLLSKIPDEALADLGSGVDIETILEALNLPEDFELFCILTFNADKAFKDAVISVSKAELNLSSIAGTDCVLKINDVEAKVSYSEVDTLSIPEDVISNAVEEDIIYDYSAE